MSQCLTYIEDCIVRGDGYQLTVVLDEESWPEVTAAPLSYQIRLALRQRQRDTDPILADVSLAPTIEIDACGNDEAVAVLTFGSDVTARLPARTFVGFVELLQEGSDILPRRLFNINYEVHD